METALKNANRENESLRTEMETLRKKMETLREENETLREENETLREENERTLAEEKNKREKAENQLANLKLDTSFLTKERLYDFLKKEQTYNQFFSRLGDIEDSESYPEEFDQSALKERWRNLQDSISQCFGNQNDPPAGVSDLGGLLMESIFGNSHMWPNYDPQDNRLLHCLFQCLADGVKRDNANPGPQSGECTPRLCCLSKVSFSNLDRL
jgi:regulator of replication initiation timing